MEILLCLLLFVAASKATEVGHCFALAYMLLRLFVYDILRKCNTGCPIDSNPTILTTPGVEVAVQHVKTLTSPRPYFDPFRQVGYIFSCNYVQDGHLPS